MLLAIILVVIIVAAGFTVYLTSPTWLPRSTTLTISPADSAAASGTQVVFAASVKYGSAAVGGGTITWQTSGGSLSKNTGTTVIFIAPTVTSNESFTITASFGGTGVYQSSSATTQVKVYPPKAAQAAETFLTVTPSVFEIHGGGTQALTATLQPSGAPSDQIVWSLNPAGFGSLSSTTGAKVNYTAPSVEHNSSVTITATFAGNDQYKASTAKSDGSVLPAQVATKNSTVLEVTPSTFSVGPGGSIELTAEVEVGETPLTNPVVTWSLAPTNVGSLSSTTGYVVTYSAPTVQQNTTVTITASFAGDASDLPSSGVSRGVVTPPSMAQYLYTLSFSSAVMTRLSLTGPIILNGTSVTLVTAESANLSQINLTRFGLTASTMYVDDLTLYSTYINGTSPGLGGALSIKGGQTINIGPKDTVTFGSATIGVLRMEGDSANLTGMACEGENVGGSEPYIPSVITAPTVSMSNKYSITGPTTWQSEVNMVSNLTTGRIDLPQFQLLHPVSFTFDRHAKVFNATEVWSLSASSATAIKVSAFIVYFRVTGGEMVTIIATGSDNPNNLIPFGLNTGGGFQGLDITVAPVYFSASQLGLGSFVISITPPSTSGSSTGPMAGPSAWGLSSGVAPRFATEARPAIRPA